MSVADGLRALHTGVERCRRVESIAVLHTGVESRHRTSCLPHGYAWVLPCFRRTAQVLTASLFALHCSRLTMLWPLHHVQWHQVTVMGIGPADLSRVQLRNMTLIPAHLLCSKKGFFCPRGWGKVPDTVPCHVSDMYEGLGLGFRV